MKTYIKKLLISLLVTFVGVASISASDWPAPVYEAPRGEELWAISQNLGGCIGRSVETLLKLGVVVSGFANQYAAPLTLCGFVGCLCYLYSRENTRPERQYHACHQNAPVYYNIY